MSGWYYSPSLSIIIPSYPKAVRPLTHTYIQILSSLSVFTLQKCASFHIKIRKIWKRQIIWFEMLYTIILMASFHLRVLFSPPLLMDIFIPSFNHTIFFSFVFYAFLLFNFFFFFWPCFLLLLSGLILNSIFSGFSLATVFIFLPCFCLSYSSALPSVISQYPSSRLWEYLPPGLSPNLISAFCCYIGKESL